MSRVSIRQPLVIYAVVFALFITLAVLAFSGLALSRTAGRAYRRAVRQELTFLARARILPPPSLSPGEVELGLISTASPALGLGLLDARARVLNPRLDPRTVVVPLESATEEIYLVAALPPSIPTSIALVELSRIMPPVLMSALLAAGLMAFLVYRQLLPSLNALADLADEPPSDPEGFQEPDAPNEIVEIALRFRHTTRMLRTARERAETQRDELKRMQSSLIRASKLASVGRLAAGIAHELGNPLAAVKGYLRLMQDGLPEQDEREVLTRSIRELDRMHQVIRELLTYARSGTELDSGPEVFDLRGTLSEALALAGGHPELREVELEDHVPDDGLLVSGQAARLGQVLINLLLNAAQAMRDQENRRIHLSRERHGNQVHLFVADTGPGIPSGLHESVFDPFFTTKGPGEGTGLGLAVSRAMMEAMQGGLELRSATDEGATFSLRLAVAEPAPSR